MLWNSPEHWNTGQGVGAEDCGVVTFGSRKLSMGLRRVIHSLLAPWQQRQLASSGTVGVTVLRLLVLPILKAIFY